MVICFDASQPAKTALDELMRSGDFQDISEAISMSLVNYEVIRKAVTAGGGHTTIEARADHAVTLEREIQDRRTPTGIPELFGAPDSKADALTFPEHASVHCISEPISPRDWLWGQYNRFLPAKATCRALLSLMARSNGGVPLDETVAKISYAACGLGDFLNSIDVRLNLRREDTMRAAFPTSDINGGEGRLRFGNQFVAALKQERLRGLPGDLKLIICEGAKEPKLLLTKAGAAFAKLANPVLDTHDNLPRIKLSEEEVSFLLSHIRQFVPEESSAFVSVIDGIEQGANTPEALDRYLRSRFNLPDEAAMKTSFLSTQRTGAISRMADLGLVAREKEGLRVTYTVTHPGKYFRSQIE